jgi:hypothetical protein
MEWIRTALMAALVLALGACTASVTRELDTDQLESEIASGIEEQTGAQVSVDCPGDVDIEAGSTFTCTAMDEQGTERTVRVTQTDDEGNVDWELED